MQCITSYDELFPRALNIKRSLISQENTQVYKDNRPSTSFNENPYYWAKNKNVTSDGVVDAKVVLTNLGQENTQPMNTQQLYAQPPNNQPMINATNTQCAPKR